MLSHALLFRVWSRKTNDIEALQLLANTVVYGMDEDASRSCRATWGSNYVMNGPPWADTTKFPILLPNFEPLAAERFLD